MPYKIVKGDLLNAETEYIVQQNCCTSTKTSGLSEAIAKKFPGANIYEDRRTYKGNWAVLEDRPEPGTIFLYEFEKVKEGEKKGIICAFAQYTHGKPGMLQDPYTKVEGTSGSFPVGADVKDSAKDRQGYFQSCLEQILLLKPKSVGFPYKIGCGLAGGSWGVYEKMIRDWSSKNPKIDVVVYQLE